MENIKVGDYGTACKSECFRYAVKILKIEGSKCTGVLLSFPDELATFNKKHFLPRGHFAGMMLLEHQIIEYEKVKDNYPNPKLDERYNNFKSKNKPKGFGKSAVK